VKKPAKEISPAIGAGPEPLVADAVREKLLLWYSQHARMLPWRASTDPYPIFLSEVILQQTRVAQGLPYFERFLEAFPSLENLAQAPEEQVMRLWQGLGYYSRARNMHAAAKKLATNGWPKTAAELQKLPGIGPYTAAAIASLAFGEPVPVLDGNVARVLARWLDIEADIAKPATQNAMRAWARQYMGGADPARFNQAMMEFGALHCTPATPKCSLCSLQTLCLAYQNNTVALRPVKAKAGAKKERFLAYIVVTNSLGQVLVTQRKGRGIWQNLYTFPELEGEAQMPNRQQLAGALQTLFADLAPLAILLYNQTTAETIWQGVHLLSHQRLQISVLRHAQCINLPAPQGHSWVSLAMLQNLAKPVPIVKATEILVLERGRS